MELRGFRRENANGQVSYWLNALFNDQIQVVDQILTQIEKEDQVSKALTFYLRIAGATHPDTAGAAVFIRKHFLRSKSLSDDLVLLVSLTEKRRDEPLFVLCLENVCRLISAVQADGFLQALGFLYRVPSNQTKSVDIFRPELLIELPVPVLLNLEKAFDRGSYSGNRALVKREIADVIRQLVAPQND